jgi:hypothetical protein
MAMSSHRIIAGAATLALALTPTALANKPEDPGSKDKGKDKAPKAKSVSLKGVVVSADATTVTITVKKANRAGRWLVGDDARFTVTRVNVADTNGDGATNALDFVAGDKVHVQAKLAKDAVAPYAARKVVNQTHPAPDEDETEPAEQE